MQFLDQAKVYVRSGGRRNGGRRLPPRSSIEFGGPRRRRRQRRRRDPWNAWPISNTLLDYRYQQHFKAKKGGHGKGQ